MAEKTEKSTPTSVHRTERVLIFMIAAIVVLSIASFAVIFIARVTGAVTDFTTGAWPAISVLPLIGLPLAILLIIAYVVASGARRVRENRGTTR